ncbi:hypothetical protein MEC_01018 [Bartonella alsatica IBS 382]|uniref:Uncharacterized protein n=1 Tax=Bartonella alsatica IBS 382 TaxID=1094551 RepID=J0PWF0_9HYPH|nr:hypothetical protein MEC_01018 [Bartonella alsatica IBS 382]
MDNRLHLYDTSSCNNTKNKTLMNFVRKKFYIHSKSYLRKADYKIMYLTIKQ